MITISKKLPKPPVLAISTEKCSSCGKSHKDLEVTRLIGPAIIGNEEYDLVAQCPETWEPIYIREKK